MYGTDYQVLKDLGKILKHMALSHDAISRKGGEEFTMMLVDCRLAQAALVAESIRKAVESHEFSLSGYQNARITVSIGVSSIPETTQDENILLDQADKALYRARQSGRNKVIITD